MICINKFGGLMTKNAKDRNNLIFEKIISRILS